MKGRLFKGMNFTGVEVWWVEISTPAQKFTLEVEEFRSLEHLINALVGGTLMSGKTVSVEYPS